MDLASLDRHLRRKLPKGVARVFASVATVAMDVDGVLTDGSRLQTRNGLAGLVFNSRDGLGIYLLLRAGVHVVWLSANDNRIISMRAEELGVHDLRMGTNDKASAVRELRQRGMVAVIGDDIWDLGAFAEADVAIAVRDAHPRARSRADVITRSRGGRGAVREVCDLVLAARRIDPLTLLGPT